MEIGPLPGRAQQRILREIRETLSGERASIVWPGVAFSVNTFLTERIEETITGFAAPLAINIYGNSLDALDRDAQQVAAAVSAVPGARDVQVQAPPGTPQLSIRLRHDRAAALGSPRSACCVHQRRLRRRVGQIYSEGRVLDLVVVLEPTTRNDIGRAGSLQLRRRRASDPPGAGRRHCAHQRALQDPACRRRRLQTVTANVEGRDAGIRARRACTHRRAGPCRPATTWCMRAGPRQQRGTRGSDRAR